MSKSRVVSLFSTPVMNLTWDGADLHNVGLAQAINARRATDGGVRLSNINGWQSDDGMGEWGGSAARALLTDLVGICDAATVDLKQQQGADRRFRWVSNMWANVSGSGASNQTHSHPGAYWSAVYYVDDGYGGSSDKVLGGELVFLDPRMPMVRMGTPDIRYRRPNGETDHQEVWFRPNTARLLIFPSWLMHNVRPYHGNGTRISIAINLSAVATRS